MLVAELERLNSRCTQQLMYPTVNVPNLTFSLFIQQQSILDVFDRICITYTVRCQNVESVTRVFCTREQLHHISVVQIPHHRGAFGARLNRRSGISWSFLISVLIVLQGHGMLFFLWSWSVFLPFCNRVHPRPFHESTRCTANRRSSTSGELCLQALLVHCRFACA